MAVSSFHRYPLADRDHQWDGSAAEKRVRSFAGADDAPNAKYRDAHLWYDADKPENYGSYKLLVCDVIGNELHAVPRAIEASAGIVDGARGGLDVPDADRSKLREVIGKYYDEMGDTPPWKA